jgi:hypothetical protein
MECRALVGLGRSAKIGSDLAGLSLNFLHREIKGACLEVPLILHEEVFFGARSYTCTDMNRHLFPTRKALSQCSEG